MESENMITVEKAEEHADLVLRMNETTFGEEAREKIPGKQKGQDKEIFLKCLCALLNSGGGVLHINIENQNYNYTTDALGKDLEDSIKQLLDPNRTEDFLEIEQKNNTMYFFVKSWSSAKGNARLFSLNSGLVERSGTSALSVSPSSVINFLKRQQEQKCTPELDVINNIASDLYNRREAALGQKLDFGESDTVEFKSFSNKANGERLLKDLKEKIPTYLSAFGNTRGGFLFIGIDDKTREVAGFGQGIELGVLRSTIQDLCNVAKARAIHVNNCKRQIQWKPEIKFFAVTGQQENPPYIVAIKIPPFCCAVFEKDPKSWEITGDKVSQIKCNDWLKKQQPFIPDDDLVNRFESALNLQEAPPRCKPVYSIEKITELQKRIFPVTGNSGAVPESICNKLFTEYPGVQSTFTHLQQRSGILIVSRSWAVDINQSKNEAVVADALLITSGDYPRFYSIVENETDELWTYARETAFHLKQKLVNLGGYTGRICVTPHLVKCNTGELIQNKSYNAPLYPQSYKLGGKEEIEALLRSLVIVVLSFTSPLSDKLGSEFLNLLTEEQFKILHDKDKIKPLFIHGLPGTGKTMLAMEKIKRIRNMYNCSKENILYLCEKEGLKTFVSKHELCICETRSDFMEKDDRELSAVKHIVVDEGQNFHEEDGDWYGRAKKITKQKRGVLWVFLDYFQKCHDYKNGLPPIINQSFIIELHTVVRNSTQVFEQMKRQITEIVRATDDDLHAHLNGMREKMTQDHSFGGEFSQNIQRLPKDMVKTIVKKCLKEGHSARDIAVLFSTEEDANLTTLRSEGLSFPHGKVESIDEDVVVMDTISNFSGLERNIVIVVCPFIPKEDKMWPNILLSAYSRARIRLYVLKQRAHSVERPEMWNESGIEMRRKKSF